MISSRRAASRTIAPKAICPRRMTDRARSPGDRPMFPLPRRVLGLTLLVLLGAGVPLRAETRTIARCGAGFLEEVDGYRVLHVKGTPYEMGYQQGALLKDDIRALVRFLFDVKAKELKLDLAGYRPEPKAIIAAIAEGQRRFVPARFFEELRGVADGSGVTEEEIIVANF